MFTNKFERISVTLHTVENPRKARRSGTVSDDAYDLIPKVISPSLLHWQAGEQFKKTVVNSVVHLVRSKRLQDANLIQNDTQENAIH